MYSIAGFKSSVGSWIDNWPNRGRTAGGAAAMSEAAVATGDCQVKVRFGEAFCFAAAGAAGTVAAAEGGKARVAMSEAL